MMHPKWAFNYLTNKKFELANVSHWTKKGSSIAKGVMEYINEQYDPAMSWKDAEYVIKKWGGPFAIKGVMSVEDAKRAADIGASAIMLSNHGGRAVPIYGHNIATLVVSLGIPANECVFPENLGKCSTIESRNLRAPTFILVVPLPPLVIEDMRVVEK